MVHSGYFLEPSDQNMMIKSQVLLSIHIQYKHQADSPSANFENFWRQLMLIQKIELNIAKEKEKLEAHWKKWDTLPSDISQINWKPFAL